MKFVYTWLSFLPRHFVCKLFADACRSYNNAPPPQCRAEHTMATYECTNNGVQTHPPNTLSIARRDATRRDAVRRHPLLGRSLRWRITLSIPRYIQTRSFCLYIICGIAIVPHITVSMRWWIHMSRLSFSLFIHICTIHFTSYNCQ